MRHPNCTPKDTGGRAMSRIQFGIFIAIAIAMVVVGGCGTEPKPPEGVNMTPKWSAEMPVLVDVP